MTLLAVRRGDECLLGGCVTITRPDPPPSVSFGTVLQGVDARAFAGKRIVYRVAVRVEGSQDADIALPWLRVDLAGGKMGFFDNMQDRPVRPNPAGSNKGWAVYEIAGPVDPAATQIYFGVLVQGKARAWIDQASLSAEAPPGLDPQARPTFSALYQRLDAAQSSGGRLDDLLALALPTATVSGAGFRVPLADFFREQHQQLATSATTATVHTELLSLTVSGDEATVATRTDALLETANRARRSRSTTRDRWERSTTGEWKRKEVDLTTVRSLGETVPPSAVRQIADQLATQAVPLATVEPGAPSADLAAFGQAVGPARIVSLGEASHGTREIFQMKHRLLEYLVKEKGFTVFAIEANWPESQAADRYIKTGEGDPRAALRAMRFWTWQTEEVLAMLEWMRAFNQAPGNHPTLSFTSFDMQFWPGAVERVVAFIKQHGTPQDAAAVAVAYQWLAGLSDRTPQDPAFVNAAEQAERVTALFTARREALVRSAGAAATRDALRMTRIVVQALRNRTPGIDSAYRDERMADNVAWLAREVYPGQKIVLWAHNGHVAKVDDPENQWRSMGSRLRETFGREMYVLGFAIHTGTVRAFGSGPSSGMGTYEMPPAPAGSGTAVLSAAGRPLFFLNFAPLRQPPATLSPLGEFLEGRFEFRDIGAMWATENAAEANLRRFAPGKFFDGLIYLEKTQAARGL
jgi:erythromycin esterase